MDNTVNLDLLYRIYIDLDNLRTKLIDVNGLVANLSSNISALENINSDFIGRYQSLIGEIKFTQSAKEENSNKYFELIKRKVNEYESYLCQYFLINRSI